MRSRFRATKTRLLEINPFLWLACRKSWDPPATLATFAVILVLAAWATVKTWSVMDFPFPAIIATGLLHLAFRFRLADLASKRLVEERESGTMEWLLSTPLTVQEILLGQRKALGHQLLPAYWFILCADVSCWVLMMLMKGQDTLTRIAGSCTVLLAVLVMLLDNIALIYLSMLMALTTNVGKQAAGQAVVRILFLPWGLFFLIMTGLAILSNIVPLRFNPSFSVLLGSWCILSIAVDAFYIQLARTRLHRDFRKLAVQRMEPPPLPFWRKLLRSNRTTTPPVISQPA